MVNNKIVKARCIDANTLYYDAPGRVERVFDTNGAGELIPVAFCNVSCTYFNLHFAPHGTVYAEITTN
jgi:hypothetical protein